MSRSSLTEVNDDFWKTFWRSLDLSKPSTVARPIAKPRFRAVSRPIAMEKNAAPMQWSDIPAEMKAKILGHIETKKDLKACRLVDKSTGAEATRWLFHTVCLWPNIRCLQQLLEIAERPQIAVYVRALECHRHQLQNLDFAACITDGFLADRLRVLDPIEASYQTYQLTKAYDEETVYQFSFQQISTAVLSKILRQFPHIETFIHSDKWVRAADGKYLLHDSSSLWQRTGIRALSEDWLTEGFSVTLFLNVAHGLSSTEPLYLPDSFQRRIDALPQHGGAIAFKPIVLELLSHHWQDFYSFISLPRVSIASFLEKVRFFKLVFEVQSFQKPQALAASSHHWATVLNDSLRLLGNVLPSACELWLGFDETPLRPGPHLSQNVKTTSRMTRLLLSSYYPQLKEITLENTIFSAQSLREFVQRHSNSLRSITIKNLHLVNLDIKAIDLVDRLLKLIIFIHDQTRLTHFSIQGVVEDITGMRVRCGQLSRGSLLHEICEYVCHREEFPFEVPCIFWDQYVSAENVSVSGSSYVFTRKRGSKINTTLESDKSWMYENPAGGQSELENLED